jgi:ADP-heptose:LPS heptosyltransferase
VRNRAWNAWLRTQDFFLDLQRRADVAPDALGPRRLLIAIGGHAGDAIIATSVLQPIRATWPLVRIGVVTGSWNRTVLAGHPDIEWLHSVDHWKLDRSSSSWFVRAWRARTQSRSALADILAVGYDAAVDLYPYFPNSSWLLKRARIPVRIGFSSGGGGPRYTTSLEWSPGGHVIDDHSRILAALGVSPEWVSGARYHLPPQQHEPKRLEAKDYVVLHMGAGNERKTWPAQKWTDVARALVSVGFGVVLTGKGGRDASRSRALSASIANVTDLCDRLSWAEFQSVLAGAHAVVTLDTAAAHLAAGAGTPAVVLATGIDQPARWSPVGDRVRVLSEPVPCSPCYRSNGCPAMSCIATVTTDAVLTAIADLAGDDGRLVALGASHHTSAGRS